MPRCIKCDEDGPTNEWDTCPPCEQKTQFLYWLMRKGGSK
jgi:hypothetical protein